MKPMKRRGAPSARVAYGTLRRVLLEAAGRHPLLTHGPVLTEDGSNLLTIDMRRLKFASPFDLAATAAVADAAIDRQPVRVLLPDADDVASYVVRMNLLEVLHDTVTVVGVVPTGPRKPLDSVLVELTRITSPDDAQRVGGAFAGIVLEQFGDAARSVFRATGELLDNAVSHGRSAGGAFAAVQYYTGATSGREGLEFAICDNGIGVLNHLRHNQRYAGITTSRQALKKAVKEKVSGVDPDRGYGLFDVVKIIGSLDLASLVIASGDASLFKRQADGRLITEEKRMTSPIGGTWAWLRVRLPRRG